MKEATAKLLVDLVEDIGEDAELREDYSARGMYGTRTCGIVVESEQTLVQALASLVTRVHGDGESLTDEQVEALESLSRGYRTDNMGYELIIY